MKMTNEQFREVLIKAQAGDNEAMTDTKVCTNPQK